MKVLNIVRFLPIEGFPAENDITFKIYSDLKKKYCIESLFIMPLPHIPKWATYIKKSLKNRYKTINNVTYQDKKYKFNVKFFESTFPAPFIYLSKKYSFFNLIFQYNFYKKRLYKIYTGYLPDIIHAHTITDAYYAYKIFQKYNVPYIVTLRGSYSKLYQLPVISNILNYAKYVVTPSYSLFKKLKVKHSIELLPHGLDESWYSTEKKEVDTSIIRLITVSRLLEMKNIQIVIKCIAKLKNEGYQINYSIVGDGPYKEELEILVNQHKLNNNVKFYGKQSQDEIKNIYKENDIFIMISTPETFGRVYFEAAAQGLLIVGVQGTGPDGYFTNEEAYFIQPTVEATTNLLRQLNSNSFKSMTDKTKEKMKSFKNSYIIDRYYEILNNIDQS